MIKFKKLSEKEKNSLYNKVCLEGFGYYMFDYGPDLDLISRLMNIEKSELEKFCALGREIQDKIFELEE